MIERDAIKGTEPHRPHSSPHLPSRSLASCGNPNPNPNSPPPNRSIPPPLPRSQVSNRISLLSFLNILTFSRWFLIGGPLVWSVLVSDRWIFGLRWLFISSGQGIAPKICVFFFFGNLSVSLGFWMLGQWEGEYLREFVLDLLVLGGIGS